MTTEAKHAIRRSRVFAILGCMSRAIGVGFLLLSLALALSGVLFARFAVAGWYSLFVVGGVFTLAWLNYILKRPGLISDLVQFPRQMATFFILAVLAGMLVELLGRGLLGFWAYPDLSVTEQIMHVFVVSYPFAFLMIVESFVLVRSFLPAALALPLVWLVNTFMHEVPNTWVGEWVYSIPVVDLTVGGVNVVVISGWWLLVALAFVLRERAGLPTYLS